MLTKYLKMLKLKTSLLVITTLLLLHFNAFSQCFNPETQKPSYAVNGTNIESNVGTWETIGQNYNAKDFVIFNLKGGFTYEWEVCGNTNFENPNISLFRESQFDTQNLIYTQSGTCASIFYIAPTNQTVSLLISNSDCSSNTTDLILKWRTTCKPSDLTKATTDHGGADWIISADQFVDGDHINVGSFIINSGVTATLSSASFHVEAVDIIINGTIDGNYKGDPGGIGGIGGSPSIGSDGSCSSGGVGQAGTDGSGSGPGFAGGDGLLGGCTSLNCTACTDGYIAGSGGAGSGGGAAHYDDGNISQSGAQAADVNETSAIGGFGGNGPWFASFAYGDDVSESVMQGSGGAGGGGGGGGYTAGTNGGNGGAGGGMVELIASNTVTISATGAIYCNGYDGEAGGNGGYGSLDNSYECFDDGYLESTDNCGACPAIGNYYGSGGAGGGAGGGSGGGILISSADLATILGILEVAGGEGGDAGYPNSTQGACFRNARGGSGGGGGRIKIFRNPCLENQINPTINLLGGLPGASIGGSVERAASGIQLLLDHPSYVPFDEGAIATDQDICVSGVPDPIAVSSVPTGGIGVYTYQWWQCTAADCTNPPVGYTPIGGATSDNYTPPALTGTVYYSLMVQSGSEECREWTEPVIINVHPDPSMSILASENEVCEDEPLSITATVTGGFGSCTIQWQYSDDGGSTWNDVGTGALTYDVPTDVAFTDRQYRATYDCTADGCDFEISNIEIITVAEAPEWDVINVTPPEICLSGEVTFDATITGGLGGTIEWFISPSGAGTWSTVTSPDNPDVGAWDYQPVYTPDGAGCDIDDAPINTVNVVEDPIISISTADTETCENDPLTLNASASGGSVTCSYQWQYWDGASWVNVGTDSDTYILPADSPSVGTTHRCLYTCDGEGCDQAISNELIIVVLENPDVVATADPNPQCYAEPVDLSATASNGTAPYSYVWDNGLGAGQNHTVNPTTNTTYSVTVTDDDGCTAETSVDVVVNELPNVIASATPNPVCANQPVDLTATGSDGTSPYTYEWDNGLGVGQNHTVNPASSTSYTVTVYDDNGCSNENTVNVQVEDIPNLIVTETSQATCGAENGEATATPSGGTAPYDYLWDNGDNSADGIAENLPPGLIGVTVTDDNSCTASGSVTITSPSSIVITTSEITPVTCYGGNNGVGNIDITGGTTPYDVTWTNGTTSGSSSGIGEGNFDITNLTGGLYLIEVTDADNCVETETLTINEPSEITLNTNITIEPDCFNDTDGEAEITVSGGTTNYDITWDNGSVSGSLTGVDGGPHTLTNLDAGTYDVSVTDANTCTASFTFDIIQPDDITITPTMTSEPSCFGFDDGAATVSISGGTLNYDFTWDNGSVNGSMTNVDGGPHSLTDLDVGTYTIIVTDANSCTQSTTLDITEPEEIDITLSLIQDVSCFNGNDGSLSVSITGGVADYDITYDNGSTSGSLINVGTGPNNISGLDYGTYGVSVYDNNGCSSSGSIDIDEPSEILLSASMTTDVSCYGYSDGEGEINVSGGTEPYDLDWDNGTTSGNLTGVLNGTHSISGLTAGTYTVTATDNNSCTITTTFDVTEPPQITNTITITSHANCYGTTDGGFDILISGGTANYNLDWTNGTYSDNLTNVDIGPHHITNIPGGNYSLTITDANTCEQIETFTITEPTELLLTENANTNVSCLGGTNGSIEIDINGGTPLYDLTWDNGSTNGSMTDITNGTQNLTDLDAGTYNIVLTDNNGCTTDIDVLIEEPATILELNILNITDASCVGVSDGSAIVEATGGVSPYLYSWDDPNGLNDQITNVTANTYNVTVTDDWNCSVTIPVTIGQPADGLAATYTTTEVSCPGGNDGEIILSPTGGTAPYTYNWDPDVSSTETASGLTVGAYDITINDAGTCELIMSIDVELDPNALSVEFISSDSVSCFGLNNGSLTILASGGQAPYNYLWSNGPNIVTTTGPAGDYTISVTDDLGCIVTADSTIYEPDELTSSVSAFNDVNCHGGSDGDITIEVLGGTPTYTYYWEDEFGLNMGITTATASSLIEGTYFITITDDNGCGPVEISHTINEPAADLSVSINEVNQPTCNGDSDGSITAIAAGGTLPITNYNWEIPIDFFNGQTPAGLEAGNYEVTIIDNNGCTATNTFTLNEPDILDVNITINEPSCNGDSDGSALASGIGGNGTYTYHWENTSGATLSDIDLVDNLPIGTYYLTVADILGCSIETNIIINQPDILDASLSGTDVSTYGNNDGSATANPTGGTNPYTYEWENQANPGIIISTDQTADNLVTGTYCVTVTDDNLCTFSDCILIDQPPDQLAGVLANHDDISCYGYDDGSITINGYGGTPPYIWTWEYPPGNVIGTGPTISDLEPGDYYFTIADQLGYEWDTIITISEPTEFVYNSISNSNVSCNTGSDAYVEVQVSGGTADYTYSWGNTSGPIPQNNDTIYNVPAGNYSVTINDANGCGPLYANTTVTEPDELTIDINLVNIPLCNGDSNGEISCIASGGTPAYTDYSWAVPIETYTGTNPSGLAAGDYTVTVTDSNSCTAETTYTLNEPTLLGADLSATPTTGFGSSDGEVSAFGTGGTPVYNYEWEDQANPGIIISTNETVENLPAGTYCVTVYDNNLCEYSECIEIVEPEELLVTIDDTQIDCNGNDNGSVTAIATGGVPEYSYEWRNSSNVLISTDQTVNNLIPDTYYVTITDNYGYTATASVVISEPDEIISPIATISHASCYNYTDGSVTLNVSGGVMAYNMTWYEENTPSIILSTNSILNNVAAGNYVFSMTDANNCPHDTTISITEPESIDIISVETHDLPCPYDIDTGWAVVDFEGGSPDYTFTWTDETMTDLAVNNDTILNLTPGNYTIEINDANGCPSDTYDFEILIPESFNLSGITDSVNCYDGSDGSIEVTLTGGTPDYSYSWTPDLGDTNNPSNLTANTYDLIITDGNSCTINATYEVGQPDAALSIITALTDFIYCYSDTTASVQLTISGGTLDYTVDWESQTDEGSYTLDTEGNSTIENLGAGDYTITVTDSRNCQITDNITIDQPNDIIYEFTDIIEPSCHGFDDGSVSILANGGTGTLNYLWDEMASPVTHEDYNNIIAGWHYITITDANNCQKEDSVFIEQPERLTSNLTDTVWVLCYGDTTANTMINITGGTVDYSTIWYNSSYEEIGNDTWISNLGSGEYYLSVTDANSCVYEDTLIVSEPPALSTILDSINPSCYMYQDGKIWVTVSGGTPGYNYEWDTPGAMNTDTVYSVPEGWWFLTVTDSHLCSITDSIELLHPDEIEITDLTTHVDCDAFMGTSTLSVTGGTEPYSYLWSTDDETEIVVNLPGGEHQVQVTDAHNCVQNHTIDVPVEGSLDVEIWQTEYILCYGDYTADIHAEVYGHPPFSHDWNYPSLDTSHLYNIPAGDYEVIITDSWNCVGDTTYTVEQPDEIIIEFTTQNVLCRNDSTAWINTQITGGTGSYNLNWQHTDVDNPNIYNLPVGTYYLAVTDGNDCFASNSVTITEPDSALFATVASTGTTCFASNDGQASAQGFGGTPPYSYHWAGPYNHIIDTAVTSNNLYPGYYELTVSDYNNCTYYNRVPIEEPGPIQINIAEYMGPSCLGNTDGFVLLDSITGGTPPFWIRVSGNQISWEQPSLLIDSLAGGSYQIDVIDANNCIQYGNSALVNLIDANIDCLQIPAAFSPNGDGHNDEWQIDNLHMFPKILIQVYNRWGQLLYEGGAYDGFWDGTFNGNPVPTGSYLYHIDVNINDLPPRVGTVTIVR